MDAMSIASSMQSMHTVLRQQMSTESVQTFGYKVQCALSLWGTALVV